MGKLELKQRNNRNPFLKENGATAFLLNFSLGC